MANSHDLDWVEGQIHALRPSLSRIFRKWVVGVCPPPFNDTGLVPAWLKDDGVILEAELRRSLSGDDSEAELVRIEAEITQHFEEAENAALDQASIQIAQVVRVVPEHAPRKKAGQSITAAVIARLNGTAPACQSREFANFWTLSGALCERATDVLVFQAGTIYGIIRDTETELSASSATYSPQHPKRRFRNLQRVTALRGDTPQTSVLT